MKKRRISILLLVLVLLLSVGLFVACNTGTGGGTPDEEYTFEDGRPDGELADPDEGFKIDGVLDEAAYSSVSWLEGPVLRPYYTDDGTGVYYDLDVISEQAEKAARVKMGTYYGENGVYIAYSFKEQANKVCYVNPSRRSYRNSGVELHIGIPASKTMTGDETISRLTVNANGALTVAKTQGDIWMAPYGTVDPANMPYVGLTGNGTRTDENADRTEFTFELFIPWGYFDEVGGEGTSEGMKEGGDLVIGPGIITANDYTGNLGTSREWYMISGRLDDGEWSDPQGWFHFNKNGFVAYDVTVKEAQNGAVQEWMGYDKAAKNSSLTFVTKADEGYALKEFRVNGVAVPGDYIHYDMYTPQGAATGKSLQKAYIRIPESAVTGDITAEAVFAPLSEGEKTLVANVYGADKDNPLKNTQVTFTRGETVKTGTSDDKGVLTVEGLTAGFYEVAVGDLAYRGMLNYVFFSPEENKDIVFAENAIPLEGKENISSTYREIYSEVGSLAGGFVFSGFFGFEGANYDDLTNFTNTVYFVTDKAANERFGFRFTKWGGYLMLKCEGVEYHFEGDSVAVDYFKQQKGIYFRYAVDAQGEISVYIRRGENEWTQLTPGGSVTFPIDKKVVSIEFGKQDDGDAAHIATLKDGALTVGTSRVDLPVSVTVNGEAPQEGGTLIAGGKIEITSGIVMGDTVTVKLTPDANYGVQSLTLDGTAVSCTKEGDAYVYTFTAAKQNYALEAAFKKVDGDFTLTLNTDGAPEGAADDLEVTLASSAATVQAAKGEGNVWSVKGLSFGRYMITVRAKSGGYVVLRESVLFSEDNSSASFAVTADNYGANRKYALKDSAISEGGVILAEEPGASANGLVFEGFLGTGGEGSLKDIGSKNFASALRFTTKSGYQFRVCFYIWNGQYWLVKVFEEGKENASGFSNEFGFTGNTELIDYIKAKNGITVSVSMAKDGNIAVYAMTSETEWLSLGTWKSPFPLTESIEKVEVLRMFSSGIENWTATADGELKFGSSIVDLPVSVIVNGGEAVSGGSVEATKDAAIGDNVTITLKPAENYELSSLKVDGENVSWQEQDGVYTYSFTALKSKYEVTIVFGELKDLKVTVQADGVSVTEGDLLLSVYNANNEALTLTNDGMTWTAETVPYGEYTAVVTSEAGGYLVLKEEIAFDAAHENITLTVTADNYGANRKYALAGVSETESGIVLAEELGASANGLVFEGFLGTGGEGSLQDIGSKNFASALRFTTKSGYQFRVCFYIWEGKYWLVKIFQEGAENSVRNEYAFTGNTELIDYVKEKNGITVSVSMAKDGNIAVYAMTSETEWLSLGTWKSPFPLTESIEKVELLRMFKDGIEGWTATADGELRFGSSIVDLPVSVIVNGGEAVSGGSVEATKDAAIGSLVTITVTPNDGYALSSLKVDGKDVVWEEQGGVCIYSFTAQKSKHEVTIAFGELKDLTLTIDAAAVSGHESDLTLTLEKAAGGSVALTNDGMTWTAQDISYGDYVAYIRSVSGGYLILKEEIAFAEGNESVILTVDADSYGANREYNWSASIDYGQEQLLAEELGTVNKFVYSGFMGMRGNETSPADAGLTYIAETNLYFEDGQRIGIQFIIWSGTYELKFEYGKNFSFSLLPNCGGLYEKMVEDRGVHFTIVMDGGTFTAYAQSTGGEWVQLHKWHNSGECSDQITEWASGAPFDKKIDRITFKNGTDNGSEKGGAVLTDAVLRLGTTDTGIAVNVTGTGESEGGSLQATSANLGQEITLTVTPAENYILGTLTVDGDEVSCAEENGVYTYTFKAWRENTVVKATFVKVAGTFTVTVDLPDGADASDFTVTMYNASISKTAVKGEGNVWTVEGLAYGNYTIKLTAASDGGYTVLLQQAEFAEGKDTAALTVTADSYGANRKYTLEGVSETESGIVLAEGLGASANGLVFEGFLGTGGEGSLKDIGSKNFASALRFTTKSGYSFRVCFYIWNGKYWLVKAFEEGKENKSGFSNEFAFTDNTALIDYVKEKNGITVSVSMAKDGNITVYAMTSETEWLSLGTWKSPFPLTESIEKVELLRMFKDGIEGWTATADGELKFGSSIVDLPVTVTVNGGEAVSGGSVEATKDAAIGDNVTITLKPAENYELSSLKVDGENVSWQEQDGVYTYSFTAKKSKHEVTVAFAKVYNLTINVDAAAIAGNEDDLVLTLQSASGSEIGLTAGEELSWTAENILYGDYVAYIRSESGGYLVLKEEIAFAEGNESVTLTVDADSYGANRKYALAGEVNKNGSVTLAEELGATDKFVFTGFLGMRSATTPIDDSLEFNAETALNLADGKKVSIQFITWSNDTQQIKFSYNGANIEFRTTQSCAPGVYEKMVREKGVQFAIVMDGGVFRVYAQSSDDTWVQLHIGHDGDCSNGQTEWNSGISFATNAINSVTFHNPNDNKDQAGAKLVGGELKFGTTDTGIPVSVTGGETAENGSVEVTSAYLGGTVTVTLTPNEGYLLSSLKVNGEAVQCTPEGDGVYSYTFTPASNACTLEAVFTEGGAYTVGLTIDGSLTGAADDLKVVLSNGTMQYTAEKGEGDEWTVAELPYGEYTVIVTSKAGGYLVLKEEIAFDAAHENITLTVTADNYGANRKYALAGESETESGIVLAEGLGASANGLVFEGFLGTGGEGSLKDIGSKNFASALRFTTKSGYQFRVCFYIWNGQYWLVKIFQEGAENSVRNEYAFTGNTALIDYVKEKNGITVSVSMANDGNIAVYAMTSETEWLSLGTWKSPFPLTESIEKVEVLRMFSNGIENWTATVDGELKFGSSIVDLPVSVIVNGGAAMSGGSVEATKDAAIGDNVTITLKPAENYELSSLKVDGQAVSWQEKDDVYTYSFTALKSKYEVTIVFGELKDLKVTVQADGVSVTEGDLLLSVYNANNEALALTNEGMTWTAETVPYGDYVAYIRSASGGYLILKEEIAFDAAHENITLTVTTDNYGANRKYTLQGETIDQEYPGVMLAENIGKTDKFVFKGFIGVTEGSDSLASPGGSASYGTGLRLITGDTSFRISLFLNNGKWSIRCYWQDANNAEKDSYYFYFNDALKEYIGQQNGATVCVVAQMDEDTPSMTVYVMSSAENWVLLGTWKHSSIPLNKDIDLVSVAKMWIDSNNANRTAYIDGQLSFGTTDTGIDTFVSGAVHTADSNTANLDTLGTYYWEHYSSATEGNNGQTVTDFKKGASANDCITFTSPEIAAGGYETRPYTEKWAGAVTGEAESGALNSTGYVFFKNGGACSELTLTVTVSKNVNTISLLTATWTGSTWFDLTLTGSDGTVYAVNRFDAKTDGTINIVQFFLDTASWADDRTETVTITMTTNDTLCLKGVAIS